MRRAALARLRAQWSAAGAGVPVVGITGTGGAGKSTVTDELLRALRSRDFPELRRSRSSPSTRPGAAPAARCSATASG